MRTPAFWARNGLAARLLSPAACAWALGARLRARRPARARLRIPVVCIGNLVAGGAGKTPTAIAVAALLRDCRPHFLTRGHGGRTRGPHLVDPLRDDAGLVGDEALLLAAHAPTWVSADRPAGAAAAVAAGAGVIVMDDGFQDPSLAKDVSLLVVDGGYGFGNGRTIPAGPLREPPAPGLARADAVVLIGGDRTGVAGRLGRLPVLHAMLAPDADAQHFRGRRVVAFAGIGRPAKFFATLEDVGATLAAVHPFPDHHRYSPDEIMRMVEEASATGARPVTTAKDHVRLPPEARGMVDVLHVSLAWDDPAAAMALLERARSGGHPT